MLICVSITPFRRIFIRCEGVYRMSEERKDVWFGDQSKIDRLTMIISSLSLSERNLTLSALDFQSMGLSKKHQIEAAIERADELGKVLDDLIDSLKKTACHRRLPIGDNDSKH